MIRALDHARKGAFDVVQSLQNDLGVHDKSLRRSFTQPFVFCIDRGRLGSSPIVFGFDWTGILVSLFEEAWREECELCRQVNGMSALIKFARRSSPGARARVNFCRYLKPGGRISGGMGAVGVVRLMEDRLHVQEPHAPCILLRKTVRHVTSGKFHSSSLW